MTPRRFERLEPLLRPEDVADLLQVSKKTVLAVLRRGELPCIRIGNRIRIAPEAVDAWLRRRGGRQ